MEREARRIRDGELYLAARRALVQPTATSRAIFGEHFLERTVEVVGVLHGAVDIGLAKHRLANFQSLFAGFLVHVFAFAGAGGVTKSWRDSHAFV
ncbi:MAG: hypothetical protein KGL35_15175 [Bradyrhizobium sp.]|nr:hypothetical protein [Bradyrhizobium sp.]